VDSVAAAVRAADPRLIVPCDDLTTRLLHSIVLAAPPDLKANIQVELSALIRESLGDPAFYETSVDKIRLPPLAASLGVRVIPWAEARDFSDVTSFAANHGYPLVLKALTGAGGEGVAICREASQAANAFERLRLHREQDIPNASQIIVVQEYILGETIGRPAVGWNGRELAGITRQFVVKNPPETGPGSVVRFYCEPEARIFSDALARGMGMRGFFAAQFIVHARTRELYLLEISRRVTPGHHSGSLVGVDLRAALYGGAHGRSIERAARPAGGLRAHRRSVSPGMVARPRKHISEGLPPRRAVGRPGSPAGHGDCQERAVNGVSVALSITTTSGRRAKDPRAVAWAGAHRL
jgi:hypothetical protein